MALRNQPYFPLYVQDYLTDEKLNMCSWSTQGIYIKILCVLHKQNPYGAILFKQTDKQNESKVSDFASILIKNLPVQKDELVLALEELIENGVMQISGSFLVQKRMYKDGQISEKRSAAGKSGGGNPNLFKQIDKQKPVNENEIENETNNEEKKGGAGEKKEQPVIVQPDLPNIEPSSNNSSGSLYSFPKLIFSDEQKNELTQTLTNQFRQHENLCRQISTNYKKDITPEFIINTMIPQFINVLDRQSRWPIEEQEAINFFGNYVYANYHRYMPKGSKTPAQQSTPYSQTFK